ncbi:MAG: purine-nucleoside phosphorylase [Erysipelotrichaceae bacterium]|nr:purine-nucleoside phosphorylase [Erysipelotrichaceae bacterium]
MSTPHNEAKNGDIAKTVLMPGDPLRAKFIAENFLEDVVCFNKVRNMLGYTGTYKGKRVSVMGSGMGMPSIAIYAYELFAFYGVENIIRVGSAGSLQNDVHVRDIILAQGSCTNSNFIAQYNLPGSYSAISSYDLLEKAVNKAREMGLPFHVGNVLATDTFYTADETTPAKWTQMGVLGIDMESYALYTTAAYLNKKSLTILTVSDNVVNDEPDTTAEEREKTFTAMMEIALEIA